MNAPRRFGSIAAAALLLVTDPAASQPVWVFPPPAHDGQAWRELFQQPDAWSALRAHIAGLGYADHWLNSQFSDAEQRAWFAQLARWRLGLGLEVGALKSWGPTADQAFAHDRRFWDRFVANGARIATIALDEPLAFSRNRLGQDAGFAADQTARFVQRVRAAYPAAAVGDVEPYPAISADTLLSYLGAVQARLRAAHVRGLDFFRADVDWVHFRPGDPEFGRGWAGVRDVQARCRALGLRFELIYWAADLPAARRAGTENAMTWENGVLTEARDYAAEGARPDAAVVESWLPAPDAALPETAPGTFTHSVLAVAAAAR